MNTIIQKFAVLSIVAACIFSNCCKQCDGQSYTYVDDYEDTYVLPTLTLDDSHDLLRLIKDGDEIEIEIFMFDAGVFNDVPNTLDFDLLKDLASEYEKFDLDLDELPGLNIFLMGGNDFVYTDKELELNLGILGGEGDDFIQGGSGNDGLFGGPGSDLLYGFAGSDMMGGGDPFASHEDFERDYMWGGQGNDYFWQTQIKVRKLHRVTNEDFRLQYSISWTFVMLDKVMDFQSWDDTIVLVDQ